MAGILKINSLTDADTSKNVGAEYITQGTAKAWAKLDGTGTIAIDGSLNYTSSTDNAVGDYSLTLTSALNDANYSLQVSGVSRQTASSHVQCVGFHTADDVNAGTYSTTQHRFSNKASFATGYIDIAAATTTVHGDLA